NPVSTADGSRSPRGEASPWPLAGPPEVQDSTVQPLPPRQSYQRSGLRRPRTIKLAIAVVAAAAAGTALAVGLTGPTSPRVTLPAVSGVSPATGTTVGGTKLTITGTGLANATGVHFGAAIAAITADSDTRITATSPPGTGTVDITVT